MKSVFEEIVDAHVVCPAESPEISKLRAELSRSLCPEDQKRLLRLVDGLNLLTEEAAFSNYREGSATACGWLARFSPHGRELRGRERAEKPRHNQDG